MCVYSKAARSTSQKKLAEFLFCLKAARSAACALHVRLCVPQSLTWQTTFYSKRTHSIVREHIHIALQVGLCVPQSLT